MSLIELLHPLHGPALLLVILHIPAYLVFLICLSDKCYNLQFIDEKNEAEKLDPRSQSLGELT